MASPNTHLRNARMAGLRPTVITELDLGPSSRRFRAGGQFTRDLLIEHRTLARGRKRLKDAVQANEPRAIPTSGPGRRRAKALRNQRAVADTIRAMDLQGRFGVGMKLSIKRGRDYEVAHVQGTTERWIW